MYLNILFCSVYLSLLFVHYFHIFHIILFIILNIPIFVWTIVKFIFLLVIFRCITQDTWILFILPVCIVIDKIHKYQSWWGFCVQIIPPVEVDVVQSKRGWFPTTYIFKVQTLLNRKRIHSHSWFYFVMKIMCLDFRG